jgi:hypothetical protein
MIQKLTMRIVSGKLAVFLCQRNMVRFSPLKHIPIQIIFQDYIVKIDDYFINVFA